MTHLQLKTQYKRSFCAMFCRGYRTIHHGGALYGHYTQFHLFPDIRMGIYTTLNGFELWTYSAMDQIAMYVGKHVGNFLFFCTKTCVRRKSVSPSLLGDK